MTGLLVRAAVLWGAAREVYARTHPFPHSESGMDAVGRMMRERRLGHHALADRYRQEAELWRMLEPLNYTPKRTPVMSPLGFGFGATVGLMYGIDQPPVAAVSAVVALGLAFGALYATSGM